MIQVERYTPRHIHVKDQKVQKMISQTVFVAGATGSILLSQQVSALPSSAGKGVPTIETSTEMPSIASPIADEQVIPPLICIAP